MAHRQRRKVTFITTGGTIDKIYGEGKGTVNFEFPATPAIFGILKRARYPYHGRPKVIQLAPKDSMEMDEWDRRAIATVCESVETAATVITHGTDTMIQTARCIASFSFPMTIILTGASQPAAMQESDAVANVIGALALAQVIEPGVYIFMHGILHKWNECKKDEHGHFVQLTTVH